MNSYVSTLSHSSEEDGSVGDSVCVVACLISVTAGFGDVGDTGFSCGVVLSLAGGGDVFTQHEPMVFI